MLHRTKTIFLLMILLSASVTGCGMTRATRSSYLTSLAPYLEPPIHPVIVIPGIGVTRLFDPVTRYFVWGTARNVLHTRYAEDLHLPIDPETLLPVRDRLVPRGYVGSRSPINIGWRLSSALVRYGLYHDKPDASGKPTVYSLVYDFRLSSTESAKSLDLLIEKIRQEHGDPSLKVDLIAHSAGGLVALTYLKIGIASLEDPASWDEGSRRAAAKIGRTVLIATPQTGTADMLRLLHRPERFVLRLIPQEMISTFPSMLEMLPEDGRFLLDEQGNAIDADLWKAESWKRLELGLFIPTVAARLRRQTSDERYNLLIRSFSRSLDRARVLRDALRRPVPEGVVVENVAGDCVPTAHHALRRKDGSLAFYRDELRSSEKNLIDRMVESGDGSVTVTSATGGNQDRSALFCDGHQALASDPHVHRAMIRVLRESRPM